MANLLEIKHDMGQPAGVGWAIASTKENIEEIYRILGSKQTVRIVVLGGVKNHGFRFLVADKNGGEPVMTHCLAHGGNDGEKVYDLAINNLQNTAFVASYILNGQIDFADEGLRVNKKYWEAVAKYATHTDEFP